MLSKTHGAVTLFEVPFGTAMGDGDLALLARTLHLSTRFRPRTQPRHESPGLARLDRDSGLFLRRGADEGRWTLEARTWGHPVAQSVHEWHVLAAGAARQLDPAVPLPAPRRAAAPPGATSPVVVDHPVGRVSNKRFARMRRHMVGLS